MITEPLSRAAAEKLFEKEAIWMGERDVIPFYRIVELFGTDYAYYLVLERSFGKGSLQGGIDWNTAWDTKEEIGFEYLSRSGFLKVVAAHNRKICFGKICTSKAMQILDLAHHTVCKELNID